MQLGRVMAGRQTIASWSERFPLVLEETSVLEGPPDQKSSRHAAQCFPKKVVSGPNLPGHWGVPGCTRFPHELSPPTGSLRGGL